MAEKFIADKAEVTEVIDIDYAALAAQCEPRLEDKQAHANLHAPQLRHVAQLIGVDGQKAENLTETEQRYAKVLASAGKLTADSKGVPCYEASSFRARPAPKPVTAPVEKTAAGKPVTLHTPFGPPTPAKK